MSTTAAGPGSRDLEAGTRDVTKKIRLTEAEADLLAELAEASDTSQSEVLRQGLRSVDRMRRRRENVDQLVALADIGDPEKIRFELDGGDEPDELDESADADG